MADLLKSLSIAWPVRVLSHLLQNPWRKIDVVLIIGTGRTGTKFIAKLFHELYQPDIISLHEPSPDLLNISMVSLKKRQSQLKVVHKLLEARAPLADRCQKNGIRTYIESNNNISYLLPYLKKVFPRLKLVYLTRSPESFLISEMNKKHGNGYLIFDDNDPRARITPVLFGDLTNTEWNAWSRPKKIAWHWTHCNQFILSNIGAFPHIRIKYEDLFDTDRSTQTFNEILKFIGFTPQTDVSKYFNVKANESTKDLFAGLHELSDKEVSFFKEMTGPISTKLGY